MLGSRMARDQQGALRRAAFGTIIFVLLAPGTVVVLGPWLLTGWRFAPPLFGWTMTRWLGVVLLVLALPLFAAFNLRSSSRARDTYADCPDRTSRHGRSLPVGAQPGLVSVIALLVGQALLFACAVLFASQPRRPRFPPLRRALRGADIATAVRCRIRDVLPRRAAVDSAAPAGTAAAEAGSTSWTPSTISSGGTGSSCLPPRGWAHRRRGPRAAR